MSDHIPEISEVETPDFDQFTDQPEAALEWDPSTRRKTVSEFGFVEDGELGFFGIAANDLPTTSTVVELSDVSPDKGNFAKFSGYFNAPHIEHDIFVDAWDGGSIVKGTVDAWS